MVTLADCQRTQHAWYRAVALATGGRVFSTHLMEWVWLPRTRQMLCLFPTQITETGLLPALAEAERRGAIVVGIWTNAAVKTELLQQSRFEPGAQPWWMTLPLDWERIADTEHPTPRVRINEPPGEVGVLAPQQAWLGTARVADAWAGQGHLFMPPHEKKKNLAGIFELEVAPEHRRQGVGTELLDRLAETAYDAGAEHLLLNASPEGQRLFTAYGFELIGKGRTWWYHPPQHPAPA